MKLKTIILGAGAALAVTLVVFYLQKSNSRGFGAYKKYNIVLVTIDTLRADHLPAYGYRQIKTPNLDQIASQSLLFENAIAQIPMTLPSHASILTGLLPIAHGIHDNAGYVLNPKINTLAEILKSNGYKTAAFVSSFILDSQFGLSQGFDYYSDSFTLARAGAQVDNTDVSRRAEATEAEVDTWLKEKQTTPFFLWVHYYDPHDPYDPPEPYKHEYGSSLYDGEIAYVDHVLGDLITSLRRYQNMNQTILIIAGDHGEGLGEHKERTHSLFLYRATQHVPLLMRVPELKPRRIAGVVSLIDIAPTILEWSGIPVTSDMQGKSLIPLIEGKEKSSRVAYSESMFAELHYGWSPLRSVTTADYKFIEAPKAELYDQKTDTAEVRNIFNEKSNESSMLRNQLNQIIRTGTREASTKPQQVDFETEEKLKALGYIGSTVNATAESRKVDPKDRMDMLETISRAHQALDAHNFTYVVESMNRVIAEDPNVVDAHFLLSAAYLSTGQKENGLKEMLATIALKPDHSQTLYNLGFYYQLDGNLAESEKWYLKLLKYSPDHIRGILNLAGIYYGMNQPQKAEPYISKVLGLYEKALGASNSPLERSGLLTKEAEIYFKTGNLQQSEMKLKEALSLSPSAMLYFHLGTIYRRTNRLNEAIGSFEKALQMSGDLTAAQYALAETYYISNTNMDKALSLAEAAEGRAPSKEGKMLLDAIRNRLETH
jgi:arylsulfatase A-like enzyme/Tfp pilus assembly protein PilF